MPALENRPFVYDDLIWVWDAFWELSTSRSIGMSIGPIPWTAVDRYGERHGIAGEDFEELVRLVRAMDREYVEYMNRDRKASAPPKPGRRSRPGRRR